VCIIVALHVFLDFILERGFYPGKRILSWKEDFILERV
jgi:hypothetical protein